MRFLITGGSGFIGSNLIEDLLLNGQTVLNVDLAAPLVDSQRPQWVSGDIRDASELSRIVGEFDPDYVVHLAALTALDEPWETLAKTNVEGTENLLKACLPLTHLRRLILASTQYVNGPGAPFDRDDICFPDTDYGRSKVEMEHLVTRADYNQLPWILVRPTNVWGKLHLRNATELWKFIKYGYYFHPGGDPIVRCYSYVGNVVKKIEFLMQNQEADFTHRVVYLTEEPGDSALFLDQFSLRFRGKPVRRIPYLLMRVMAIAGDILRACKIRAPFYTDRLRRMTTSHGARVETIWDDHKVALIGMEEALDKTCEWLKRDYPQIYGDLN